MIRPAVAITLAVMAALACAQTSQSAGGETKPFPADFKTPTAKVEPVEAPEGSAAAWRTEHFLLLSDEAIPRDALKRFATTIESVPEVMEALLLPPSGKHAEARPVIRLCRDEQRFTQFGGPASSAGYFQPRKNTVLIRADLFLFPQRNGSTRLKDPPEEDLLVHELSHLAMAGTLSHAPPWLSEGIAEYLSVAHQRGGHYRFNNSPQFIRSHFAKHLPTKDLRDLELPSLRHIIGLSHREWSEEITAADASDRYLPYASSLLFVHYFLEGGNERRAELSAYLNALRAQRFRRQSPPDLGIDDPGEIEDRLTKFWTSRGLKVRFSKS